MAELIQNPSTRPGRGWTMPNPVRRPRSTQPPQTATAAARPMRPSGQARGGRTGWRWLVRWLASAGGSDGDSGSPPGSTSGGGPVGDWWLAAVMDSALDWVLNSLFDG